jgi:hypothetical protein
MMVKSSSIMNGRKKNTSKIDLDEVMVLDNLEIAIESGISDWVNSEIEDSKKYENI